MSSNLPMVDPTLRGLSGLDIRTVRGGGRDWRIASVQDEGALLALAGGREPFPFGLLLWEGAVVLADEMAAVRGRFPLARVLELGCGVGLAGLVAASFGARVTMTDHDPLALKVAKHNAQSNDVAGITFVQADWNGWDDLRQYDVIIGADVLYERAAHGPVLSILSACLACNGVALLADPGRHEQAAFLEAAADRGFAVSTSLRTTCDLRHPGKTVRVTVIRLARAALSGVAYGRG
ncbi:MAG: methyltransferase domain-containing protein [Hyphomicrobiaceae bacterium]|nr:methyltransferase domain-containing protein [Hyphomicrobiaceae bacterium]